VRLPPCVEALRRPGDPAKGATISTLATIGLGAIAGLTIFLGLPMGRLRSGSARVKTFLNGLSAGILVFLLLEIFQHSFGSVEEAFERYQDRRAGFGHFLSFGVVFAVAFGVGLLALLYVGRLWRRARTSATGASLGPGAMAVAETPAVKPPALRLGMAIATGIGLHNFSEGLAIGQSARNGSVSLALLLVIGFALHNTTEGFGIVGPLAAEGVRPTWGWLAVAGLVGGGPTFLGTVVGTAFTSALVSVAFLSLAGGAILYVVGEILNAGRRMSWEVTLWGVLAGFLLGMATELILVAAGV
jgi:ZIP family zinc transporter